MQYLLILDSFKGSVSSAEAALHIKRGLDGGEIIPFSDGGEGFLTCVHASCGGEKVYIDVPDSYGRIIQTCYLRMGDTGVIETALADGLVTVGKDHPNILGASTVGTGLTIRKAMEDGCRKIIIGFGGSATNDGGAGALHSLGARFYNGDTEVSPSGLC
ncbi:MAG: glycerate kinase, partial [Clostridia bacterium]|nr:glycerate kinase [Clostridia bacterium]